MGHYTNNLFKKNRTKPPVPNRDNIRSALHAVQLTDEVPLERLVSCALIRGDDHIDGEREHWRLREKLGDKDPYRSKKGDREGFMTDTGRFVDRNEARRIAADAGQCDHARRELLSSDIDSW